MAEDIVKAERVRVFVDFWNFQLSMNRAMNEKFPLDWGRLGPVIAAEVAPLIVGSAASTTQYEGLHVYMSYNPSSAGDRGLRNWASNVIDRLPGVQVVMKPRKVKGPPKCPDCHAPVTSCPACGNGMTGTVEKGVDTAIVTDMIRLAWEDAYDIAVLLSSDADFVPAVEFLDAKGRRVVHGAFPPKGAALSKTCWASIDLKTILPGLRRV